MVTLIPSFLDFLKDPQKDPDTLLPVIGKVIMTGCLKVAKNSIFTGVNNLVVNTVTSQNMKLTGIIGFPKDENLKALTFLCTDQSCCLSLCQSLLYAQKRHCDLHFLLGRVLFYLMKSNNLSDTCI